MVYDRVLHTGVALAPLEFALCRTPSPFLVRAAASESKGIIVLMDPALASLLGAIVGGLIGGGSNVGLDMVRARRERAGAEAREDRDARRAARLIAEELDSGRRLLASSLEADHRTWHPNERQLSAASWARYSTDFALVASDDQWDAASSAYAAFDALNWHIRAVIEGEHWTGEAQRHPMEPPPAAGSEDDADDARDTRQDRPSDR